MAVAVVTDSAGDIPPDVVRRLGVAVVPLKVHFGTRTFEDNVTITPDQFYSMLAESPELPTTSLASPSQFKEIYDKLGEDADGIVSIHLSSRISGTYASALEAARTTSASCPVEVVDSAQGSMGLGLVVIEAAEAANRGAGHDEVAALARDTAARAQSFTLFQTLEYLVKGGRIGKAGGLLGSMLNVKPMTIMRDGTASPLGRARTFTKALYHDATDRARLCARRGPGGYAQHDARHGGKRLRATSVTCCRRGSTRTSHDSVRSWESTSDPGP